MSVAEYNIHMEGIQFIYFFYRNISLNNYEGNNYITFLFFFLVQNQSLRWNCLSFRVDCMFSGLKLYVL